MTTGEKLFVALGNKRTQNGGILTREQWIATADAFLAIETAAKKRRPKGAPRERNPLFDALALATGTKNLDELSRNGAKAVGVALADILQVCPELTVDEITRRVAAYRRRWPDPRNLSPTAIAKYWAQFGGGDKTRLALSDPYQEPAFDWKAMLRAKYSATSPLIESLGGLRWSDIPIDERRALLAEGNKFT